MLVRGERTPLYRGALVSHFMPFLQPNQPSLSIVENLSVPRGTLPYSRITCPVSKRITEQKLDHNVHLRVLLGQARGLGPTRSVLKGYLTT